MYNAVTHLFFRSESGRGLRAARRLEAALSPSRTNADESLSTLNYAKCRGGGPKKSRAVSRLLSFGGVSLPRRTGARRPSR